MPLVFVQRYRAAAITGVGTQTVTGTLTLGNPTIVEFDSSTFTTAGTYTIFTFDNLVGNVSYLQADSASLTECSFSSAVFQQVGNTITVTLS